MRDAAFQGVPLVIGGEVECRGEEREADPGKENQPKPLEGARSKHLENDEQV